MAEARDAFHSRPWHNPGLAPPISHDAGEVRELVVHLGTAMLAAGDSVDAVLSKHRGILGAYGLRDCGVIVLPTMLLVETGSGPVASFGL